ncbi:MAG: T9SS type A sorting domain-containing protein [Bacteroidota bacterium]
MSYDASNLPAGVYVYTLETNKGKETKRLVIIK